MIDRNLFYKGLFRVLVWCESLVFFLVVVFGEAFREIRAHSFSKDVLAWSRGCFYCGFLKVLGERQMQGMRYVCRFVSCLVILVQCVYGHLLQAIWLIRGFWRPFCWTKSQVLRHVFRTKCFVGWSRDLKDTLPGVFFPCFLWFVLWLDWLKFSELKLLGLPSFPFIL